MKKIRNPKSKFLCMVLVCCMLVTTCMPLLHLKAYAAGASRAVAKVGNTEYENYQQAWAAVKNGGELTMLADWHITEMLTVAEDRYVTVHMNGHMINRGLTQSKDRGGIFLVEEDGLLILNGDGVNSTEHWGTVQNGKWSYRENGQGTLKINGALLTGGYNDDGGAVIHMQENADVRIDGVTIAGNACSDDVGGAIRLQGDDSKLTLTNSTIAYNRSDDGGGTAIGVEGDDSLVTVSNAKIHHNLLDYSKGDGGAIQINNGRVEIINSELSYNEAGRNGGAIYVYNGDLVIDKDTVISYNVAGKEGGAVYVDSKADEVKISGCYIGNRAVEEGGAVYVNSNISGTTGVRISNAEMLGNIASANAGGAVYVDSDDEIGLSGQVVMQGNSPDNLHIRHEENILENSLTEGSQIGIFTSWDSTKDYYPVETGNYQYFFSDKTGYEIKGDHDEFYFVKGSEGAPASYRVGNSEYAMIKGTFSHTSFNGYEATTDFYYSDGYFAEASKHYNEHLASLAASVALAVMPAVYEGEYTEDKAAKYIMDMLVAMGYSDLFVHYPRPEYFGEDAENLSTIGYIIAKKTIVVNGVETTMIATAVRGSAYGAEWVSNVTLGDGFGEAKGFGDAARQIRAGIDQYITDKGINTDSVKFFITGYSRAGAASNLVAKKLTDVYGEDKVYAYCFEAPKGGVFAELKEGLTYTNIHNVINAGDIVATVGTEQMGFIRYGIDHIVPGHKVGSDAYEAQKKLMLAQLATVNKLIQHNDYFHEATLEYAASSIIVLNWFFDLIDEEWFPDYKNAEDWIPHFVEKVQEYSMTDMEDKSDSKNNDNIFNNKSDLWHGYRNFYSNYKWYLYFDEADGNKIKIKDYATEPDDFESGKYTVLSLEDAIANLTLFYYGASNERKAALADLLGSIDAGKIMGKLPMYHIWTVVIDNWHELSIDDKNTEFHNLWNIINTRGEDQEGDKAAESIVTLEDDLKELLTDEEYQTLMTSLYVAVDFLLDFVAEDCYYTDQNILGTLLHNIGSILQTHNYNVAYSWVRSYDSFYSDIKYVCAHNYGEWSIVKEASTEDYGVRVKTCTRCNESAYEAIPKIVIEDNTPEPPENQPSEFSASLFGEGSMIAIIFASIAAIAVGAAIYFYVKLKKEPSVSPKDDEC